MGNSRTSDNRTDIDLELNCYGDDINGATGVRQQQDVWMTP